MRNLHPQTQAAQATLSTEDRETSEDQEGEIQSGMPRTMCLAPYAPNPYLNVPWDVRKRLGSVGYFTPRYSICK